MKTAEKNKAIKHELIDKSWTQGDLAREAGLPRPVVNLIVQGRLIPTPMQVARISAALGKAPNELFS